MLSIKCWNNKASDIKLVYLYATNKMMHGPINIRHRNWYLFRKVYSLVPGPKQIICGFSNHNFHCLLYISNATPKLVAILQLNKSILMQNILVHHIILEINNVIKSILTSVTTNYFHTSPSNKQRFIFTNFHSFVSKHGFSLSVAHHSIDFHKTNCNQMT
jgi:hypothetical protein